MHTTSRRQALAVVLGEALVRPAWSASPPQVPLYVGTVPSGSSAQHMLSWMAARAGVAWESRPTPWLRAQKLIAEGEGVMFGLTRTPQREQQLRFSRPIWFNHTWIVVREGDQGHFKRYGDLNGQPVCWARGSSYGELFTHTGLGHMDARESSDDDGALRMAAAGRCRAALITLETDQLERALRHPSLAELSKRHLALVPHVVARTPLHFATGLGSRWTWVIERIDRVVAAAPGAAEKMRKE
jgi:ABC-type amino acid transport substrate-binding protein